MAAPVAASLILPDDTTNTGDKLRTQTRVVGSNTVHEHFFRPVLGATLRGRYWYSNIGSFSVTNTVQTGIGSSQHFNLQNPIGSGVVAVIRRIVYDCSASAVTAAPTAAMDSVRKFTFTGSSSGGLIVIPSSTSISAAKVLVQQTSAGITMTLLTEVASFQIPAFETAVGIYYSTKDVYSYNPLAFARGTDLEIAPGEGIVFYLSVAGSVSDPRSLCVQCVWDEFDLS